MRHYAYVRLPRQGEPPAFWCMMGERCQSISIARRRRRSIPRVRAEMLRYLDDDFGNAGSRTHDWGRRARAAVEQARDRSRRSSARARGDVIFTSGATESNNLAILGPGGRARRAARHIVSTAIEHHAVLEPLAELDRRGFEVTLVDAGRQRLRSTATRSLAAVRPDTLLVSMMHVNNETGVIQPVAEIADLLDADRRLLPRRRRAGLRARSRAAAPSAHRSHQRQRAQDPRPEGRRRAGRAAARRPTRPPLQPLMFGGGQERGLRPGTLPVPLIAGFGLAAELARRGGDAARQRAAGRSARRCLPASRRSNRSSTAIRRVGAPHRQSVVSRPRGGSRHRRVERLVGDLERRGLHVADATPAATCSTRWASAAGGRRARCGSRGAQLDRRTPDWEALVAARRSHQRRISPGVARHERTARGGTVYYRRSRFTTHLPRRPAYSPAHYWLLEESPASGESASPSSRRGCWATSSSSTSPSQPGAAIEVGDEIGWIEGLRR